MLINVAFMYVIIAIQIILDNLIGYCVDWIFERNAMMLKLVLELVRQPVPDVGFHLVLNVRGYGCDQTFVMVVDQSL